MAPDREALFQGPPTKCGRRPGSNPGPFSWRVLIMNLPTKLAIIGLGVTVLIMLGVAALMLWRS
jgi:hypothetical protein